MNWWLNDHTRFMFNYNQSDIGGGLLNGANLNDGATIKGFGTRAQVDWLNFSVFEQSVLASTGG